MQSRALRPMRIPPCQPPSRRPSFLALGLLLLWLPVWVACSGGDAGDADGGGGPKAAEQGAKGGSGRPGGGEPGAAGQRPGGGSASAGGGSGRPWEGAAGEPNERGVPVQVASVERRDMAAYFETQGTLEAENEVDLVARVAGPIVLLKSEEGRQVRRGDLLAQVDDRELAAQLQVAKVRLQETEQSYERVRSLHQSQLLSQEALDQALASFQTAQGEHEKLSLELEHTRITAPFDGLIVERYIKLAEQVSIGSPLFRLSDFDPLLCRIRVPERELRRLRPGQRAELTVEAWGDRRFAAKVQLVAPVVDAASGTVRVTLEVDGPRDNGRRMLQPGMFASVYLEMETRPQAIVLPRKALALDSLEDTVFVVGDGVARRRKVTLGIRNDQFLEVLSGVEAGEQVVVVGLDGLSDGTPVEIARSPADGVPSSAAPGEGAMADGSSTPGPEASLAGGAGRRGPGGGFGDLDLSNPKEVEALKARMRERGLSDAEIDQRLQRIQQRQSGTP